MIKKPAEKKVKIAKDIEVKRGVEEKLRKKPGGGSVGKYKNVKESEMAGKAGGAPEGSFPIDTKDRAKNALSRAHFAPNPEGIRKAVEKKYPDLKKGK